MNNESLFAGILAPLILWQTGVSAQENSAAAAPTASSSATTSRQASGAVAEVVVTARKRTERLQDVPLAITALGAGQLASHQVAYVDQISQLVPNMQASSQQGHAQLNITSRGIGLANQFNTNTTSSVGLYQDEVYEGFRPSPGVQLFDLERVEVLRGPQGTLYGRNTTGGAINFISRLPSLAPGHNGYATIGYGNYDRRSIEGAFEQTLIDDKLGVRLALSGAENDGYYKNIFPGAPRMSGENYIDGRLIARAKPVDGLDIVLKLYYNYSDPYSEPLITYGIGPGGTNPITGFSRTNLPNNVVDQNTWGRLETQAAGAGLRVKWDRGPISVVSISQFDYGKCRLNEDCDGSPFDLCASSYSTFDNQFAQDLRVLYAAHGINAVIGAYFATDTLTQTFPVSFGGLFGPALSTNFVSHFRQVRTSEAIYGELNYPIMPKLNLTVGARGTWDSSKMDQVNSVITDGYLGPPVGYYIPAVTGYAPGLYLPPVTKNDAGLTGRVILDYHIAGQVMTYASYSRGYRSGVFNGSIFFSPAELNFVGPETINSYELGLKSTFLDQKLTVNLALFRNDLKGQQVDSSEAVAGAVVARLASVNGYSQGIELETHARVTNTLTFNGSVGILGSRYDDGQSIAGTPIGGDKFPFAPDVTANVGVTWTIYQTDQRSLVLDSSASYMGHFYYDPENGKGHLGTLVKTGSEPYWLLDGRLTYKWGRYSASVWGKNLTDQFYLPVVIGSAEGLGSDTAVWGTPRTFGVEVGVVF